MKKKEESEKLKDKYYTLGYLRGYKEALQFAKKIMKTIYREE